MVKVHMAKGDESMAELFALAAPYGRNPTFRKKLPFVGVLYAKVSFDRGYCGIPYQTASI